MKAIVQTLTKARGNLAPIWRSQASIFLTIAAMLLSATLASSEQSNRAISAQKSLDSHEIEYELAAIPLTPAKRQAWIEAIRELSNYDACISSDDSDDEMISIDYERVYSLVHLEVCLFLIAREVRNLEILRAIIRNSGFNLDPEIEYPRSAMRGYGINEKGIIVGGGMSFDRVPGSLITLADRLLPPYRLSISLLLTRDVLPVQVSATFIRL